MPMVPTRSNCLGRKPEVASATRLAYVVGVSDGYHIAGGELCTPEAKIQEIVDVAYKYVQDHPEELHLDGDVLIVNAMKHAWPCK
jgi:Ssp1 endopeptidase immunity protein Rap1a